MYFYINKSDPSGRFHKHTFIFNYIFLCGWGVSDNKFFWISVNWVRSKSHDFLFLNINILILHYASMQSEINGPSKTDLLKQCISELKTRIAKLEDKQTQNELIKNLMFIPQNMWPYFLGKF